MLGPENTPASGSASEYLSQGVFTGLLEPAPANDMGGTFAPPGVRPALRAPRLTITEHGGEVNAAAGGHARSVRAPVPT